MCTHSANFVGRVESASDDAAKIIQIDTGAIDLLMGSVIVRDNASIVYTTSAKIIFID